jgi:hypothetical protein
MADGGETTAQQPRTPRVLIPSLRRVRHHPVFSAVYECEDVIDAVSDADLAEVEFRNSATARLSPLTEKLVRRLGRRPVGFPYYEPVELTDDYDVLFEFVVGLPEVEALDGLRNWRRHCRTSVLFIWELWPASLDEFRAFYRGLERFDHIYVGTQMVAEPLSERLGREVRWLPPGTDVLRFRPKAPEARTIDILSLGRRSDVQHQAASELRDDLGWHYVYDTASGMSIEDHVEHRTLVAENLSRAKFFVSNRGKFNDTGESAGVHDFGNRFFDGTAGGAVVVGEFAKTTGFASCFDWGEIGVDLPANDPTLAKVLATRAADTGWMAEVSIRNASETARRHDWAHRWASVLDDIGLDHGPALRDRLAQLDARSAQLAAR